jgi:hypothetical protein
MQRRGLVDVLGEARIDVLADRCEPTFPRACGHVGEVTILCRENSHVGDDLALGAEHRRVLTLTGEQRGDVVRHEPVQDIDDLRPRETHPRAMAAIDDDCATAQRLVFGGDTRIRENDRLPGDVDERFRLIHSRSKNINVKV